MQAMHPYRVYESRRETCVTEVCVHPPGSLPARDGGAVLFYYRVARGNNSLMKQTVFSRTRVTKVSVSKINSIVHACTNDGKVRAFKNEALKLSQ